MVKLITDREMKIINKKIRGLSVSRNESNILSKSIRPKLEEVRKINASSLLKKLEYNQAGKSIENKIKRLLLKNLNQNNIKAIIIYGSAIQNNYKNYRDIDILVITKHKNWSSTGEKYDRILELANLAKKISLNLDIQVIDKETFSSSYPHSPSLIYQLKDHKVIYGRISLPKKAELSKLDLRMKLDWSDIDDENSRSSEIYQSLRNAILVKLLIKRIVNNELLSRKVSEDLGRSIIDKLKINQATKQEKRMVLEYLKSLVEGLDRRIKEAQWEKIVL